MAGRRVESDQARNELVEFHRRRTIPRPGMAVSGDVSMLQARALLKKCALEKSVDS